MQDQQSNAASKEEYIRSLIHVMSTQVAPHLVEMSSEDLLKLAVDLSLLSPVVQGMEQTKDNVRKHQIIGLGCAAIFLMVTAKAINTVNATQSED